MKKTTNWATAPPTIVIAMWARKSTSRYPAISPHATLPAGSHGFALAIAMRDQAILDFPLCNKSFNLSYCGHDL